MNPRRVSNKLKQKQLETKYLQEQTKKMQDKLSQLKKQVEQQKQLKASSNFQSTVSRWRKDTRSDAPLKSYAKQILQQQKSAYKKFGIDQKKITGTKTFTSIKKKLKQQKQYLQQRNLTKIPLLMSKTSNKQIRSQQLPIQTIQNNFFKAKMDIKSLIKQKTVLEFLQQIFLQQYINNFNEQNITQLSDLRFLSKQQLDSMGIIKGHQIKIMKKIKQQFQKDKSPTKMIQIKENISTNKQSTNRQSTNKQLINNQPTKQLVQMGYGQGNINDYDDLTNKQNNLNDNFDQILSENLSENQQNDLVLITVPLSQFSLQTGQDQLDKTNIENSILQNCFNCYKYIPLRNQLIKSPDNRHFCSENCLKVYQIQMQKTCPQCRKDFFKPAGFYQQGFWFCSIGCCPNKDQIQEMFYQWTSKRK